MWGVFASYVHSKGLESGNVWNTGIPVNMGEVALWHTPSYATAILVHSTPL